MAILKHVPSHNPKYSAVIDYLTKEHDEKTGKALLDEYGQMVDRDEYLIEGINCTPDNFAELCVKDCIRFRTNRKDSDIKTHQYILSFDPKDAEKGLTLAAVQEEGLKFAKENFPGHRCIVCAHPDGKNGSENIHVHIVISSVRFEDRPPNAAFMKLDKDGGVKKSEYKAGYKHQDTARLRMHLNAQLQKYCRENGYTVTEQKPLKKVTNKEYVAKKKGQAQLDKDNSARFKKGLTPAQTEFKTKKDDLRAAITQVVSESKNWDEFTHKLRNDLTRRVEVRPDQQRIPYTERQELWARYKLANDEFWTQYKREKEERHRYLIFYYQLLVKCKDLEWEVKRRNNDAISKLIALYKLTHYAEMDRAEIKLNIAREKERQKQFSLNKNVYQMYAKAAKIALSNNMKEEAEEYLLLMEKYQARQNGGYWVSGEVRSDSKIDYNEGRDKHKSLTTWKDTKDEELIEAQFSLLIIQKRASELEALRTQPEIHEEPFPIDVKISRGAVSFKHPDLDRWTRGKSLGSQFELEALAHIMEANRLHSQDAHPVQPIAKKPISQNPFETEKITSSQEIER